MSNNTKQLEAFTIWSDEVGTRLDPFCYRPVFKKLVASINDTKHKAPFLAEIVEFSIAGDWGKDPDTLEPTPDHRLCYVLRNTNFDNKYNLNFDDVAQRYIKIKKIEKLVLQKGDILIEKSGGSPVQPVGRVAFIDELPFDKPVVFSNFLQKIRIADSSFLPEYIFTFLQTIYHLGYTEFLQNQTTGIKNLRLDDFFKIKVPKLPMAEQKKIADLVFGVREKAKESEKEYRKIISSIDDYILDELDVDIPKSSDERVFQIWSDEVGTRLNPSYYRPIFKILEKVFSATKYNVQTLKTLATKITSGATPLSGGDAYMEQDGGVPFVRSGNINPDNEIDFNSLVYLKPEIHNKKLKSSQLKRGDLMVAIVGATIGQVSVYQDDREANINQAIALIRLGEGVNSEYAKEFLYSKIGQIQLEQIKRPVARANINLDEVGSLKIIYPSMNKQNEMVDKIKRMRAKAKALLQEADSAIIAAQKQVEQMILE